MLICCSSRHRHSTLLRPSFIVNRLHLLLFNPLRNAPAAEFAINLLWMKCVTHLFLPREREREGKNQSYCKERQNQTSFLSPPDTDIEIEFIDASGQELQRRKDKFAAWLASSDEKVFFYSIDFIRPSIHLQNEIEKFKLNLSAKSCAFFFPSPHLWFSPQFRYCVDGWLVAVGNEFAIE